MCWATECSRNDGSKTQYYIVILDRLQGRSGALERAPESRIRGLLTVYHYTKRATLARLLANEGEAIYVVHLNRYFVIPP